MKQGYELELGDKARDTLSGFEGIVTGIADYLTGCRQASIQAPLKSDGTLGDHHWFDVTRLLATGGGYTLPGDPPETLRVAGGPQFTPPSR